MTNIPIFTIPENIPQRVGLLLLDAFNVYDDPRAGVCFRYRFFDFTNEANKKEIDSVDYLANRIRGPKPPADDIKVDTYLYNLGLSRVPTEILSKEMNEIFEQALYEIVEMSRQGLYRHFEILMVKCLTIPSDDCPSSWIWATMRYRQVNQEATHEGDRISHLAIKPTGGFINKVRYTYPASLYPPRAYTSFLFFLFDWEYSLQRAISGKRTLKVGEASSDKTWVHIVEELNKSQLPHPLGFFDQPFEEEKKRQKIKKYFDSTDKAYKHLEGDEVKQAVQHELAHSIFSILEQEMFVEIDIDGGGAMIDLRRKNS